MGLWASRKAQERRNGQQPKTAEERINAFRKAKERGLIPSSRAKSKERIDIARHELRLEKQRIFKEAFYDVGMGSNPSPGEVDTLTSSEVLNVERGEVLQDPKVRGYKHPVLRDWFQVPGAELRARVAAEKSK